MGRLGIYKGLNKSNEMWQKALQVIATGTQTFSRSPGVFPDGASPKYLIKEKGSHVWDVDGNEYLDMVMGCGPVTLGHNHPITNKAIKDQLKKGILFSLLNPLEIEVAKKLHTYIPFADLVKFSKNGSDVCGASVKLARYITNKDMIFCCGYHGFQDWYIGSTDRNSGIPQCVRDLTKTFNYNDIEGLEKLFDTYIGNVACVIMEPIIGEEPKNGFLEKVRDLTHKHQALLIFDEMITGFRFGMAGAGVYFGVHPDLATFGKGITNGMPLGVICGRKEYMKHFDKVFLSSTYAPETLTLACASKVIDFYNEKNVVNYLWQKGVYLSDHLKDIIAIYNLEKFISIVGLAPRLMVNTHDKNGVQNYNLATLYQQEMFKRGILCFAGTLMLSYSHTQKDLDYFIFAFKETCKVIKNALDSGQDLIHFLHCKPMSPVFKGLRERNAVSN